MCVCDLGVAVRNRDLQADVTVVLRIAAVVGGDRGALPRLWGIWIVGL